MCVFMCLGVYLRCVFVRISPQMSGVLTQVYLTTALYGVGFLGLSPAFGSSMSCSRSPGRPSSVKHILSSERGMWTTKWGSPSTTRQETKC